MTYIQTAGRNYVDLADPDPDQIDIEDIAHGLSHICRWVGHTRQFYSVAEHSLLCCNCADPEHALEALLHDAAEAYVGDVSTPLKAMLGPIYTDIEQRIDRVIRAKYGLPEQETLVVKRIDQSVMTLELQDIMHVTTTCQNVPRPRTGSVWYYPPGIAKRAFLSRFYYLQGFCHA